MLPLNPKTLNSLALSKAMDGYFQPLGKGVHLTATQRFKLLEKEHPKKARQRSPHPLSNKTHLEMQQHAINTAPFHTNTTS